MNIESNERNAILLCEKGKSDTISGACNIYSSPKITWSLELRNQSLYTGEYITGVFFYFFPILLGTEKKFKFVQMAKGKNFRSEKNDITRLKMTGSARCFQHWRDIESPARKDVWKTRGASRLITRIKTLENGDSVPRGKVCCSKNGIVFAFTCWEKKQCGISKGGETSWRSSAQRGKLKDEEEEEEEQVGEDSRDHSTSWSGYW